MHPCRAKWSEKAPTHRKRRANGFLLDKINVPIVGQQEYKAPSPKLQTTMRKKGCEMGFWSELWQDLADLVWPSVQISPPENKLVVPPSIPRLGSTLPRITEDHLRLPHNSLPTGRELRLRSPLVRNEEDER